MKKFFGSFVALMMLLTVFASASTVAYAAEIAPCEIIVSVTDLVNDCDGVVELVFHTTVGDQKFVMAKEYWGKSNKQSFYTQALGEATVTATVTTEGWEVVDANSFSPVGSFEITANGKIDLDLSILPTKDNEKYGEVVDQLKGGSVVLNDVLNQLGISSSTSTDKNTSPTSNNSGTSGIGENLDGADEVYQNFLNAIEIMKTDSSWEYTTNSYYGGIVRNTSKNIYLNTVKNATEDKWNAMSGFDIFVYNETYLRFASMVTAESDVNYLDRGEDGIKSFEANVTNNLKGTDSDKVIEAYDSLVRWQTEFYTQYGYPYNFVTRKTYAEETGIYPTETEEETAEFTDEEVEEILENAEVKEKSVWDSVLDKLAHQWFTIIISVVLLVGFLVVRHICKKRAMDEMTDDGK